MRTIYRTYFELSPQANPDLDSVRSAVLRWAHSRPNLKGSESVDLSSDSGQQQVGPGSYVESRLYNGSNGKVWGIRLTNPDAEPDVSWVSETTVYQNPENKMWVSCSLHVGRDSQSLSPVVRQATRPGIVKEVLSVFKGEGILPLTPKPYVCSAKEAPLLLKLLESPRRHLPVVFVSTMRDGSRLRDTNRLADQLCGLAYVVVADSSEVAYELGQHLSDRLNCFDGGVRIYWPQFTRHSRPFDHPLWTRAKINQLIEEHPARLGANILNKIAGVSVYTSSPTFISWSKIIEWQRAGAIEQARASNNQQNLLTLFEETNKDLEAQVQQLKAALEEKAQEAAKYRMAADSLRHALQSGDAVQASQTLETSIESVKDALAIAANEYPDQLAFCWNSKSEDDDSVFEKPDQVLQALRWLGTAYHDARMGRAKCPDFDHSLRNTVEGWSYEAHQSKGTMKHAKFREWYHTRHNGKEVGLPEHLRCGSTKDARYSIRIAFSWCPQSQRVILGYLGQHQETSAS